MMGRICRLFRSEWYGVQGCRLQGSGSFPSVHNRCCSHICGDNIPPANGDSWYHLLKISKPAWDFLTRMLSYDARFLKTSVTQIHSADTIRRIMWYLSDSLSNVSWICTHLPLHIASLANYQIEIRFRPQLWESSSFTRGVNWQISIINNVSLGKEICVTNFPCTWFCLISVTELFDIIICRHMWQSHTGHVYILDTAMSWWITDGVDIV